MDLPRQPLRGLSRAAGVVGLLSLAACGSFSGEGDFDRGRRWLEDPVLRRAVLEDSLVRWDNGYAQTRLDNYTDAGWGARPAWRPRIAAATTSSAAPEAFLAAVPEAFTDEPSLVALGRAAFDRYPVQIVPELAAALPDAEACGLEVRADGTVEGVVWVELPDGPQPALTCSACHGGGLGPEDPEVPGARRPSGRANARFDLGAVLAGRCGLPSRWGPGRVDVTPDEVDNPTAIPDLRPIRWQRFLQRAGTVENGRLALAVRTETLIITSLSATVRPPREVALGLSWWMWGLADALAEPAPDGEAEALFDTRCGTCHGGEGRVGGLRPLSEVGTDLAILESPSRRTGFARVPSLRGLGDRGLLFSGGAAPSFEAWWSGEATVPGHPSPAELPEAARTRLGGYLEGL